ncbi:MAG: chemotaxis protein CheD [Candidatus Omnitrophota bacterium]
MAEKIIEINMADMKIAEAPAKLITRGLGSCLGIVIYNPVKKIGGMAHPMLPDINHAKIQSNPHRFVNSVIIKMVDELERKAGSRANLITKLFGGAHMFNFIAGDSILNVGERNIVMAKAILNELGIKILAEDTGGSFGRTVELDLDNGRVLVKTVNLGEKEV